MAGTDHTAQNDWGGPGPIFVLVRPQMGENIGGAARAMWNFGLDRMRLVDPRDGWPNSRAVAMASGAGRVLDHVRVDGDVPAATADLHFTFATTARTRDLTKPVFTPEAAMAEAARRIARGENVGVLFGPERAGLENADLVGANALISVPVNPAFASLNLAQCVLLTAYEWRRAQGVDQDVSLQMGRAARPALAIERQKLNEHLEAKLDAVNFFWPEPKRDSLLESLRALLARFDMTDADIRMFHGIIRALTEKHPAPK
ncbi:MAG: RNA methyltransferase [Paracoccaceae bacterium]